MSVRSTAMAALVAALLLVVGGGLYGGSLLLSAYMRNADKWGALGLVASESRKPVTLGMHATREHFATKEVDYLNNRRWNVIDQRITFTLPAAYVTVIDLKEGPELPQRLEFELWSRSFDPVMPDRLQARRECRSDHCRTGAFFKRREGGEDDIRVEVNSDIGTPAQKAFALDLMAGLVRTGSNTKLPCVIGYDKALDLVTIDRPSDFPPNGQACNFSGGAVQTRDGVWRVPRHFAKRNLDGSLRYIVRCNGFSNENRFRTLCTMHGYFGIWRLNIWVPPNRIAEWNDLYNRVTEFLNQHVVSRTDQVANTGQAK